MAALRNYENGTVAAPDARAAAAYMLTAQLGGRPDLAQVFQSALHRTMGISEVEPPKTLRDMMKAPAETLLLESMNHFEKRLVATLLACTRGQGAFKKYQKSVFQALMRPYNIPIPDSLRFLERETLAEQVLAFEKAKTKTRQPRKERVSA